MAYINVDIDVDDFYDDLSSRDKQELINLLKDDGYLESNRLVEAIDDDEDADEFNGSPMDHEWYALINKINKSRYQLTKEQEQLLIDLAKSL
jgi:hypothetical protein